MYSNLTSYLDVVNNREIKMDEIKYLTNIELVHTKNEEGTTVHTFHLNYETDSFQTKIETSIYLKNKLSLDELLHEIKGEKRQLPVWTKIIGDIKVKETLYPFDFNELFQKDLQNKTVFFHLLDIANHK